MSQSRTGAKRFPTIAVASVGSIVGLYGGATVGYRSGGAHEDYRGLLVGMTIGTVVGATVGATIVTHDGGLALMGSVVGTVAGFLVAGAIAGAVGEEAILVAFSITHGVVTGLIASR